MKTILAVLGILFSPLGYLAPEDCSSYLAFQSFVFLKYLVWSMLFQKRFVQIKYLHNLIFQWITKNSFRTANM